MKRRSNIHCSYKSKCKADCILFLNGAIWRSGRAFAEVMRPAPVDPYGIAVAVEETLKVLGEVHEFEWNIAVPHNIVGEGQKYMISSKCDEHNANRNRRVCPQLFMVMVNKHDVFHTLTIVSTAWQRRTDPEINQETINIGPDEEVITINDLASLCANETAQIGNQFIISVGDLKRLNTPPARQTKPVKLRIIRRKQL